MATMIDVDNLDEELEKAKQDVKIKTAAANIAEDQRKDAVNRVRMISALISIQQGGNGNA